MKNYQIRASKISDLVILAAALFKEMNKETKAPNHNLINLRDEATQMHFVADLLKELVETAYPRQEPNNKYNPSNDALDALIYALDLKPINKAILEDIEKDFQNIAKMMKNYKSPKAGEF